MWGKKKTPSLLVRVTLKISMLVSQEIGNQSTSGHNNNTFRHVLKEFNSSLKDICSTIFITVLFIVPILGNNLDNPQLTNG